MRKQLAQILLIGISSVLFAFQSQSQTITSLTLDVTTITAGNSAVFTVTLNQAVSGSPISVSLTAPANVVLSNSQNGGSISSVAINNRNSSANFYFKSGTAGTYTITATLGSSTKTATINVDPAPVNNIITDWSVSLLEKTATNTFTPTVLVDALNNTIPTNQSANMAALYGTDPTVSGSTRPATIYTWKMDKISGVGISHFNMVGFGDCYNTLNPLGKIKVQWSTDPTNGWTDVASSNLSPGADASQTCFAGSDNLKVGVSSPSGANTMYYRLIILDGYYPPKSQNIVIRTGGGADACVEKASYVPICTPYCSLIATATGTTVCVGTTANLSGSATPSGTYTYAWTGPDSYTSSSQSPSITNAQSSNSGTYTLTVTESSTGCSASTSTTVVVNASPTVAITGDVNVCYGLGTTLTAAGSGGKSAYTYAWTDGPAKADYEITSLTAGASYVVTVTDANGCIGTNSASVVVNALPTVSVSGTSNVSCYGGSNGSITLNNVTNGKSPYSYKWTKSGVDETYSTNANLTGLVFGDYNVTVTDANNCSTSTSVIVTEPSAALSIVSATPTAVKCFSGNDGSIALSVTGGTSAYTYSWTGGASGSNPTGLTAGTYNVTVTDANNCSTSTSVIVTQPTALSIVSATPTAVKCFSGSDGSIVLDVTGGTPSYTYSWTGGASGSNPIGLTAGTYNVTVTDANNCSTSTSVVVTEPSPVTVSVTVPSIACNAGKTTITINGGGGTSPLKYSINNGDYYQESNVFDEIAAGEYYVKVTDANGCSASMTETVSQPAPVTPSVSATAILCNGGSSTITVSATGGTGFGTYTYTLNEISNQTGTFNKTAGTYNVTVTDANNCSTSTSVVVTEPSPVTVSVTVPSIACNAGKTTITINGGGGTSPLKYSINNGDYYQESNVFDEIAAGEYYVKVTDANGCSASMTETVSQPAPVTPSVSATAILCNGGSSTITVSATGGTGFGTYTYTLNEISNQTGTFNKTAGTYNVTVTDANNCSTSTSVVVTEPSPVTVSVTVPSIACNAGKTTITINGGGGTSPLKYSINNGDYYQESNVFDEIAAGEYYVKVTDANGCSASMTETVSQPAPVTPSVSATAILCNGGSSTITVSATGGTGFGTYTYTLNEISNQTGTFNKTAGTYNVTVTDANNCSTSTSVIVTQPTALSILSATPTAVKCFSGSDGSIVLDVTGGTPSYTYSWTGGVSGSNPTGLTAGTYNVTVTDANNCSTSTSVIVTQPTALSIVSATPTAVKCFSGSDGSIVLDVTGGTPSYTYSWTGGASGSNPTGLTAGTYNVTVTDANNCSTTASITITEPDAALSASIDKVQGVSCQGSTDGYINLSVSGGTTNYTYSWSGPSNFKSSNQNPTSLAAGTYNITVTDKNGCTYTTSTVVSDAPPCYPYYTYSQGYYGNSNFKTVKTARGTESKETWMSRAFDNERNPVETVYIGAGGSQNTFTTNNGKKLVLKNGLINGTILPRSVLDQMKSMIVLLPAGGTASSLISDLDFRNPNIWSKTSFAYTGTTSSLLKNGKFNNVLIGQVMAMYFNLYGNPAEGQKTAIPTKVMEAFRELDLSGLLCKTSIKTYYPGANNVITNSSISTPFPNNVIKLMVYRGKTKMKDLVDLGIEALGSTSKYGIEISNGPKVSYSEITAALDAMVKAFHGGMFFLGEFVGDIANCNTLTTSYNNSLRSTAIEDNAAAPITSPSVTTRNIQAKVYPNPYTDRVNIQVTAKKDGKASLILYNMNGQRVATFFEGEMKAGTQTFNYAVPVHQRHGLIYIFRQNGEAETGKLLGLKR